MGRLRAGCLAFLATIGAMGMGAAEVPGAGRDMAWPPPGSPVLESLVTRAVQGVVTDFSVQGLRTNEIAVTLVNLTDASRPAWASYRGGERIYPASVVKLFYLVAAHRWMEDGRLEDTPELRRALRDMIVESSNDATHYVVDLLTGTTSGPELTEDSLRAWADQRDAINRYFQSLGFAGINVNKKPWGEGPYGREMQAIQRFEPKRNWLTTDATARLLVSVATGKAVTPERSRQMMELLGRDVFASVKDPEDQTHGFTGIALLNPKREGVRLWSKAGWTSETRHDAAYVELPDGRKFVLVVFTTGHAHERNIVPGIVRRVLDGFPN